MVTLFMYDRETTWPGLVIVFIGLPVYYLLARRSTFNRAPERDFSEEETPG